jgi:hypothetical protein
LTVDAMLELLSPIATVARFDNGMAGATVEGTPSLAHKETIRILFDRLTVHDLFLLHLVNTHNSCATAIWKLQQPQKILTH